MDDLISRKALGVGRRSLNAFTDQERAHGWNDLLDIINAAPAVDAEPVRHGRWEKYAMHMMCPECCIGFCYYKNETDRFKYCPNCGAKMDLEGDDGT